MCFSMNLLTIGKREIGILSDFVVSTDLGNERRLPETIMVQQDC